jgi:hypothetical protein
MDIMTMPVTWKNLAKVSKQEKEELGQILELKADDENLAKYIHLGLAKMISRSLPLILAKTFPNPGEAPAVPHLRLELWTDGVEVCATGAKNDLWPIVVSVLAVGSHFEGPHRIVPPAVCKPIVVGYYLGGHKPSHGNALLRNVVDELKVLDPRTRPMSDRPHTKVTKFSCSANFTVSVTRFIADTLARSLFKNIYGHMSHYFCEKCEATPQKLPNTSVKVWPITALELREDALFESYARHAKKVGGDSYSSIFVSYQCFPGHRINTKNGILCVNPIIVMFLCVSTFSR